MNRPKRKKIRPQTIGKVLQCSVCDQKFLRSQSAQKKCNNCRFPESETTATEASADTEWIDFHSDIEDDNAMETENERLQMIIEDKVNKIQELEEKVADLLRLIIGDKFVATCQQQQAPTVQNQPSYAQVARSKNNQQPKKLPTSTPAIPHKTQNIDRSHRLVLKKGNNTAKLTVDQVTEIKNNIEKSLINETIDFEITKMRPMNNGGLLVELPTKKDQQNALAKLREKTKELELTAEEPKSYNPRIIIPNIPTEMETSILISKITKQNPDIFETTDSISVVTTHSTKFNSIKKVIFQVTPAVRKKIMSKKKLKIGMCVYPVYDHVHVLRCTNCSRYGHTFKNCKATHSTCGICAEHHNTTACTAATKQCANCKEHGHGADEKTKCRIYHTRKAKLLNMLNHPTENENTNHE